MEELSIDLEQIVDAWSYEQLDVLASMPNLRKLTLRLELGNPVADTTSDPNRQPQPELGPLFYELLALAVYRYVRRMKQGKPLESLVLHVEDKAIVRRTMYSSGKDSSIIVSLMRGVFERFVRK